MQSTRAEASLAVELACLVNTWVLGYAWWEMGNRLLGCGKCPSCIAHLRYALKITSEADVARVAGAKA
jgi:hypothetical protein